MANRRQNMQQGTNQAPRQDATEERRIQTVFPWYINLILHCWNNLTISNILKGFLIICIIVAVVILLMAGQPILHAYFSAYDITIVNRLNESCIHSLCRKDRGSLKGSDDMNIPNFHTSHIVVLPGINSLAGTHSIYVKIMCEAKREVIIPLFNSGDLTGSRVFFIESEGVRQSSHASIDTWSWSAGHSFGTHEIELLVRNVA
jgi:hypothetical protein